MCWAEKRTPRRLTMRYQMPRFKVRCYERGIWDKAEPQDIEAQDEREAAEIVCGKSLTDAGKPGQFRAEVWPVSSPRAKKHFYDWP